MIKKLMIGAALALIASNAFAGAGCIGGCMGTAPNVGNVDLPAGYQCKTNWPLAPDVTVSCDVVNGPESNYTVTSHYDPKTRQTTYTRT